MQMWPTGPVVAAVASAVGSAVRCASVVLRLRHWGPREGSWHVEGSCSQVVLLLVLHAGSCIRKVLLLLLLHVGTHISELLLLLHVVRLLLQRSRLDGLLLLRRHKALT